ncbi:Metal-dependent hydrolase involved in phosphonate metabolism [Desulfosporosinus sp. BG]|nr:Metal-dependent hydrolase involved in phosphonate metabolism [Desulfosporosinus sp. BG]
MDHSPRYTRFKEGKEADLIFVRHNPGDLPIVEKAMVAGKWTFGR